MNGGEKNINKEPSPQIQGPEWQGRKEREGQTDIDEEKTEMSNMDCDIINK